MKAIFAALLLLPFSAMAASHGSGMGWFGTQVVSSLIHGVIYGVIFKLFHSLGLVPSLLLGAVILGGAYLFYKKNQAK